MSEHDDQKRRMRRRRGTGGKARLYVIGLTLALCTAAAPIVRAQTLARVDQAQTTVQGGLSVRVAAWQRVRIGRTGLVTRVDVPLCSTRRGSAVVLTLVGAAAGRRARTSARRTFWHNSADCAWYTFRFRRPLHVRHSDVVRLTVARWRGAAPLWGASLRDHNPYRRGSGHWMNRTVDDFAFRLYVTP